MAEELVENIETYLRLNAIGDMSDRLIINHIKMSLKYYNEPSKFTVEEQIESRSAITTFYGGTNPND